MKREIIALFFCVLLVLSLLAVSCDSETTTDETTTSPEATTTTPETTAPTTTAAAPTIKTTTPTVQAAPPHSGEWTADFDIGTISFTVNSSGTGITEVSIHIPGTFKCGVATSTNSQIGFMNPDTWPITTKRFTINQSTQNWDIEITGEFDTSGQNSSGTIKISGSGRTCKSDTWDTSYGS